MIALARLYAPALVLFFMAIGASIGSFSTVRGALLLVLAISVWIHICAEVHGYDKERRY